MPIEAQPEGGSAGWLSARQWRLRLLLLLHTALAITLAGSAVPGHAQFDPAKAVVEPAAVARCFPHPITHIFAS